MAIFTIQISLIYSFVLHLKPPFYFNMNWDITARLGEGSISSGLAFLLINCQAVMYLYLAR